MYYSSKPNNSYTINKSKRYQGTIKGPIQSKVLEALKGAINNYYLLLVWNVSAL